MKSFEVKKEEEEEYVEFWNLLIYACSIFIFLYADKSLA